MMFTLQPGNMWLSFLSVPPVELSGPPAGTVFPIAIPVTVTVTQTGNWDLLLDGAVRGTIVGGKAGVVISQAGDVGADVVLSVRPTGGGEDVHTRSVVVPAWTGALQIGWDATRNVTVVSGKASEIQQFTGGGAADYLVQGTAGLRPPLAASAKLNGRLAIRSTGTENMQSAAAASALETSPAQPHTVVFAGVPSSDMGPSYATLFDGAHATKRMNLRQYNGDFNVWCGSGAAPGVTADNSQAILIAVTANASSTVFQYYRADGVNGTVGSLSAGSNAMKGLSVLDYYALGRQGTGAELTLLTQFGSGYAAADWNIWEAWVQTELGFSAPLV